MDHLRSVEQNAFAAAIEEMRCFVSISSERRDSVVCPKPRRVGVLTPNPLRCQISHRSELPDAKAKAELLDMILLKENRESGQQPLDPVASLPPFFSGSPPSRADNPLVHDARFRDERINPTSALPVPAISPSGLSSPSASARKGCARMKFGLTPAAVRVEGFDCLSRDRQNSGIPAFA